MAMNIAITDRAGPAVARLKGYLASEDLQNLVGRTAQNVMRSHLRRKDMTEANALGGQRTHYYGSAVTDYYVRGNYVVVSARKIGFRIHYYGGTITAGKGISSFTGKPTVYLTIPARSEAHGRLASDFPDLVMLWGKGGPYALARAPQSRLIFGRSHTLEMKAAGSGAIVTVKPGGMQGGEVLFWLKKSIKIMPDPTMLPPESDYERAILPRIASAIERRFQGAAVSFDTAQEGGEGI